MGHTRHCCIVLLLFSLSACVAPPVPRQPGTVLPSAQPVPFPSAPPSGSTPSALASPILLLPADSSEPVPLPRASVSPSPDSLAPLLPIKPSASSQTGSGSRSGSSGGSGGGGSVTPQPLPTPLPTPAPVVARLNLQAGETLSSSGLVLGANGIVYLPSQQGTVYAFQDGQQLWRQDLGTSVSTWPTVGPDGSLYLTGNNGSVYALASDGSLRWRFTPAAPNQFRFGGLALDENGILYTGGTAEAIYALNSSDGSEVWHFQARAPLDNAPVLSSDRLYALALDQTLYALERSTGNYLWEFQTGKPIQNLSAALTSSEDIIFGSADPWLYSVSRDGHENWSYIMRSGLSASPVIDDQLNVYASTADGTLYSVDFEGDLNWEVNLGAAIQASPAIGSANEIYVGLANGQIAALALATGQRLWTVTASGPVTGKLLLDSSGKLYATTTSGETLILQTGSTAGPLGQWPMQQKQIQGWGQP